MSIPVYLFTGFLESGKTTFIQETMQDPEFCNGEKTLILLCEDGECEYEPQTFAGGGEGIFLLPIDAPENLTTQTLKDFQKKHRIDRVVIEYNGMWEMDLLYNALPKDWEVFQVINVADSTTFVSYLNNMRQLTVDKLQDPEVVIFNRCDDDTDKITLHRSVRMVNRRAQIAFERMDGSVDQDDVEDELPFDIEAPIIDIKDEDYGIWYLDAFDNLEKYDGKTIQFKSYMCQSKKAPKGCLIGGRFGMTCCADDISYIGVICEVAHPEKYKHRSWHMITAKISLREADIYEGRGPWLNVISIEPSAVPEDELVYFLR